MSGIIGAEVLVRLLLSMVLLFGLLANADAADCLNGIPYTTPGVYTCSIPVGVTTVTLEVVGGGGGSSMIGAANGGNGGKLTSVIAVTSGQVMSLTVGGGGLNMVSGGGGGSSNVNAGQTEQIIAGGGGGAGGSAAADGGNGNGGNAVTVGAAGGGRVEAMALVVLAELAPFQAMRDRAETGVPEVMAAYSDQEGSESA